jgi:hypothetical protein
MARRVAVSVRRGVSGLVVKDAARGVVKVAAMAVDAGGAMGAIGIVGAVRRCRPAWRVLSKRLGATRRLMTRRWMLCSVREMRKRLVKARRVRMVSAGGVDVADGGGDVALRVRGRASRLMGRRLGMRQMSLV